MMKRLNSIHVLWVLVLVLAALTTRSYLVQPAVVPPTVPTPQVIDALVIQEIVDKAVEEALEQAEAQVIGLASVNFGELEEMTLGMVVGDDLLAIDDVSGPTTKGITLTNLLSNTVPITTGDAVHLGDVEITAGTLDIQYTSNVRAADSNARLVIEDNTNSAYIQILTDGSDDSGILFGDATQGNQGSIKYDHATDALILHSNGLDILTIAGSGQASFAKGLSAAGNMTATKSLTIGTFLKLSAPVLYQTITDGTEDIAPAGSYHEIGAGGSVANTMSVSGYSQGDWVMIVNMTAQTITITDTGTTKLASTYGMTVDDTLTLYFDGTNWVELARSVN